ncbi:hypothetical protein [Candidatus Finniella inopinata]|uniref:Alpha/beta hydrolase n=1 Tax=Candidatus Finniella inopinata TaxID=1696036 RepID=A0A4Q7DGR4_9PROT|nr:hypothetical protein [Candidatus Finniella inopinata]RZI46081.1 hypothetical protein EQU50_03880 [Candidatus Finniella inopinata]
MREIIFGLLTLFYFITSSKSSEILYNGKDVLVEATSFGSKNIWVCFSALKDPQWGCTLQDHSQTHFKPGNDRWGQPFLSKNRIDAINVINLANHWYQTPEMQPVLDIINKYIQGRSYENVITYGLSMGGYGAVLFSEQLKANRVLAFAPRFQFKDIDRAGHARWRELLNLQPIFNAPRNFNSCEFYVFFGSHHTIDRTIIEDSDGLPLIVSDPQKRHVFPLKTSEHVVSEYLKHQGLLKPIVLLMDKGDHAGLMKCVDHLIDNSDSPKPLIHIPLGKNFDSTSPVLFGDGFYDMEEPGLWSSNKATWTLTFPEKSKPYKISIDYHAFVSCKNPTLNFRLTDASKEVFKGTAEHDEDQTPFTFTYTPTDTVSKFTLDVDQTNSPLGLGMSDDSRVLGLFFKSINVATVLLVDKADQAELAKCVDPLVDKPKIPKPSIQTPIEASLDSTSLVHFGNGFYGMEEAGLESSSKVIWTLIFPEKNKSLKIEIDYHAFVFCKNLALNFRLTYTGEEVLRAFLKMMEAKRRSRLSIMPADTEAKFTPPADQAK